MDFKRVPKIFEQVHSVEGTNAFLLHVLCDRDMIWLRMKFGFKKEPVASPVLPKFSEALSLLKSYEVTREDFLESLSQFCRLFDFQQASVYLYEAKTHMFLLKKWVGDEPSRFSISGDYEFLSYLKIHDTAICRQDFKDRRASELREPALFYFQQTLSSIVMPVMSHDGWLALINVYAEELPEEQMVLFLELFELYAQAVKSWVLYQTEWQKNKKLSEISHVKNQLLANVTHELQTPLNGILGITDGLKDHPQVTEEIQSYLDLIADSGKKLNHTLGDILKLMQIESKKNEVVCEKTDLGELIEEVGLLWSAQAQKAQTDLSWEVIERPLFVYVNPDQVRTVVMNLVDNAIKFTKGGEVKISALKSGDNARISITDTGIGMQQGHLDLVFEEFYQADGSHTRVYGGTGLGLAIAKKIVTLHGGRIWVESQQGVGSCFTFTLPLYLAGQ